LLPGHFRLARQAYGHRGEQLRNVGLTERATDGKYRYPPERRVSFYRSLIDAIRSVNKRVSISLCRETPHVWDGLKNYCDPAKCNCLIW
jgi:hypothetical protein